MNKKGSKKKKSQPLTNKQRTVYSNAHYIVYHDNATEADQFLQNDNSASHITAEMKTQFELMRANMFDKKNQKPTRRQGKEQKGVEL